MDNLDQTQIIYLLSIMAITAIPVGFLAGLFGIGGGLITVPFLFFIFDSLNMNPDYLMHLAVGTSFSIIVPTSIVSLLTHNKNGSVDFSVIKNYAVFVIIGVLSGTTFAALMDSESLLLIFTIIVFLCGAYLLNIKDKTDKLKVNFNLIPRILLGFVSGFISSTMGIGGAIMNVPILKYFGYPINKAIGSAVAIGSVISSFGAIGFLITGSLLKTDLPLSVGFINIPAFLIFIPITMFMARIGANTVHKINKSKLQRFFGVFLYIVGTIFLYRYLNL